MLNKKIMSNSLILEKIWSFSKELWPINRSITGQGTLTTLKIIKKNLPRLKIKNVKSGYKAFDWKVPDEWNIKKGYIITPTGSKICNFKENNLHVVGYSSSINKTVSLEELDQNLHSLPKQPNAIPYVTSYYKKRWGFCIKDKERKMLKRGNYKVVIDSKLAEGKLHYGEILIKGKTKKEIFISTYICHPSMANNEISGPVITTFLTTWINSLKKTKYSYRIVFIPETIGALVYLSKNLKKMKKNIIAGFIMTCLGDERNYSYLPTKYENKYVDKVIVKILKDKKIKYKKFQWSDRGSDERQYSSPGVDLPIATLMRTKYGEYPEYHTSLDKLGKVVTKKGLFQSLELIKECIKIIEQNYFPRCKVLGEPMLSKRGLYSDLSIKNNYYKGHNINDILTWADGKNDIIDISERCNLTFNKVYEILDICKSRKLIK